MARNRYYDMKEELREKRSAVHAKCRGTGFSEKDLAMVLKPGYCDKIEGSLCKAYVNPSVFWREGRYCPLASHFKPHLVTETSKQRIGQQKQKKKH